MTHRGDLKASASGFPFVRKYAFGISIGDEGVVFISVGRHRDRSSRVLLLIVRKNEDAGVKARAFDANANLSS